MVFKAVGVIPARWGSTRFPGKPLHLIAGKALLQHVWDRSVRAKSLSAVIIATDDMRIAKAASGWGAEVAMTSKRHRTGTDRVAEIIKRTPSFSHVINIQGDEPLTEPKMIDRLVRELKRDRCLAMITAAHAFADPADVQSPHQVKVVIGVDNRALYFSRNAIPFQWDSNNRTRPLRHQGIYGYTRELLLRLVRWKSSPLERAEGLEQLRALENGVSIRVVVADGGWPGVDTRADAEALERELASRGRKPAQRQRPGTR